jgi:hypothetical protein
MSSRLVLEANTRLRCEQRSAPVKSAPRSRRTLVKVLMRSTGGLLIGWYLHQRRGLHRVRDGVAALGLQQRERAPCLSAATYSQLSGLSSISAVSGALALAVGFAGRIDLGGMGDLLHASGFSLWPAGLRPRFRLVAECHESRALSCTGEPRPRCICVWGHIVPHRDRPAARTLVDPDIRPQHRLYGSSERSQVLLA